MILVKYTCREPHRKQKKSGLLMKKSPGIPGMVQHLHMGVHSNRQTSQIDRLEEGSLPMGPGDLPLKRHTHMKTL